MRFVVTALLLTARHVVVVVHNSNVDGFVSVRHDEVIADSGTVLRHGCRAAFNLDSDFGRVGELLVEVEDRVRELIRATEAVVGSVNDLVLVVNDRSVQRLGERSSGL